MHHGGAGARASARWYAPPRREALRDAWADEAAPLHERALEHASRCARLTRAAGPALAVGETVAVAERLASGECDARLLGRGYHLEVPGRAGGVGGIVSGLPDGFGQSLGRWFGGEDLSVGQWQRLALSRAFMRRAAIWLG